MSTHTQRWTVETYDLDNRTHSTHRVAGCLDALVIIASALLPILATGRRIRYRLTEGTTHRLTIDIHPAAEHDTRPSAPPPPPYAEPQWIPSPPAASGDRIPPDSAAAAGLATGGESPSSPEVLP
jgi:hypothetical protein